MLVNKTKYIILIIISFLSLNALAQYRYIAQLECIYECRTVKDTASIKYSNNGLLEGDSSYVSSENFVLVCGRGGSSFYSYDKIVADSIIAENKKNGQARYKGKRGSTLIINKDFSSNSITLEDRIGMDWFRVKETIFDFNWVISGEEKEYLGYNLKKALCNFRGREYVAWFAPSVTIANGPWKFGGLPGLIFEVYDSKYHYHYSLKGIRSKTGEIVTKENKCIESNIKDYYNSKRRYLENPSLYMSNTYSGSVSFVDNNGNPIDPNKLTKKLKYDFQEITF